MRITGGLTRILSLYLYATLSCSVMSRRASRTTVLFTREEHTTVLYQYALSVYRSPTVANVSRDRGAMQRIRRFHPGPTVELVAI